MRRVVMVAGDEATLLREAYAVASQQDGGQRLRYHLPAADASPAGSGCFRTSTAGQMRLLDSASTQSCCE